MPTRITQFPELLMGLRNPATDLYLNGGSVEFYAAGTTTAKNVWTEKEQTNAFTSYTLDTYGAAQLYGSGIYKLIIKNSAGTTIDTWDNYKLEFPGYSVVSVASTPYTHKVSDSTLVVDSASGNITINLLPAADWVQPLFVSNVGANDVIHDADGSELIKWSGQTGSGDATYTNEVENLGLNFFSDGTSIYMFNDTCITLNGLTATAAYLNGVLDEDDSDAKYGPLKETYTAALASSKTFSTLTAGTTYKLIWDVAMSAANPLLVRFNSDAGNNYRDSSVVDGAAANYPAARGYLQVTESGSYHKGELYFSARPGLLTSAGGYGTDSTSGAALGSLTSRYTTIEYVGAANVTTMTVSSSSTFSGTLTLMELL